MIPAAIDPYSFGKEVARMAQVALLADNLGIANARAQAVANVEAALLPWLQGGNFGSTLPFFAHW